MLKMISTHTSSHDCKSASVSLLPSQDLQMDCNFFLTAIRLASLNQILDPWVYLLLREILLRKFCQVASAVSRCSLEGQRETQSVDVLNKKAIQNDNVQKQALNMENCNLNEEQWVGLMVHELIYFSKYGIQWIGYKEKRKVSGCDDECRMKPAWNRFTCVADLSQSIYFKGFGYSISVLWSKTKRQNLTNKIFGTAILVD